MLLAVVLLYVGAVLGVNGIWLIGQARAAAVEPAPVRAGEVGEPVPAGAAAAGGTDPMAARRSPLLLEGREVAVINIFTGFVGVVVASIYLIQAAVQNNLASARGGGFILLFAFTYLWVAYNQYANAGGRGLGWYSAFVAVTAIVFGVYTVQNTPDSNTADLWLAANWFAWAILWAMFFALLTLELPIARITGWVAILIGIGTSWALAIALLWGKLAFA